MKIEQHKGLELPEYKESLFERISSSIRKKLVVTAKRGSNFKEYGQLSPNDREFLGFYKTPYAYEFDTDDDSLFTGGGPYKDFWKHNYPVQYFFRDTVRYFFLHIKWSIERKYRKLKMVFKNENHRHNNLIPREYEDDTSLYATVIFKMFKNFEKELESGIVDWESMDHTSDFKKWYKKTKWRIEVVLPYITKRENAAYDDDNRKKAEWLEVPEGTEELYPTKFHYNSRFKYYWEAVELNMETKILKEIIEKRQMFWT
jgi:hypothetical protein